MNRTSLTLITLSILTLSLPAASTASEIPQMPGFPIVLDAEPQQHGSQEVVRRWSLGGVVLADLDGSGDLEIIHSYQYGGDYGHVAGDWGVAGKLWAWTSAGEVMPGFPVDLIGGAYHAPSVADLDGDGDLEIVQLTDRREGEEGDYSSHSTTRLYVLDHLGKVLRGFPVVAGDTIYLQGATLYDLDQDGMKEIVFGSNSGLRVFEINGHEWSIDWPLPPLGVGIPAIGDVDVDGEPEIFVTSLDSMHLIEVDGTEMPGWPPYSRDALTFGWMSLAALADLDNDMDLEVVIAAVTSLDDGYIEVHALHHDGTSVSGWPVTIERLVDFGDFFCSPIVTDLEGDGEFDIVMGAGTNTNSTVEPNESPTEIYAWSSSGQLKPGFPFQFAVDANRFSFPMMLTAADYNGDGRIEIFSDSALGPWQDTPDAQSYLLGTDANGNLLPGFPLRPVGFSGQNGAVIGDVDNDGDYEIASVSRELESQVMYINLYDLSERYSRSQGDWLTYHGTNQRGGLQKRQYRGWRYIYAGGRTGR